MSEMVLLILIVGSFVLGTLIGAVLTAEKYAELQTKEEKNHEND